MQESSSGNSSGQEPHFISFFFVHNGIMFEASLGLVSGLEGQRLHWDLNLLAATWEQAAPFYQMLILRAG